MANFLERGPMYHCDKYYAIAQLQLCVIRDKNMTRLVTRCLLCYYI